MIVSDKVDKIDFQKYILGIGIVLFFIKLAAFLFTNSVGILADALESTVNIVTAFITLKSLQLAAKPRDEDHPYGHGKVELITASIEGILILVAGILTIIEAINRFGKVAIVQKLDLGIFLILISAFINYVLGRYSIKKGKQQNSISLVAGGKHLITDTYSSIGLVVGLILIYFSQVMWIDNVMALLFGSLIIKTGYDVLKSTINGLMDSADNDEIKPLIEVLDKNRHEDWINIHKLTYLKFGNLTHVDFHLTMPWYYDMRSSQKVKYVLKKIISEHLQDYEVDISIQGEPCNENHCRNCKKNCDVRHFEFEKLCDWNMETLTDKNRFVNKTHPI